ncbi:MAG: lysozyme inhibitor LprI family protein [Verrucomicrobiota bacterium]|nr:lysozyme inhibitor LprI family protein [Verrucomicrobiota bacterium]
MRLVLVSAVVSALLMGSIPAAEPTTKIIPTDWLPALAPSISATLEQLKEANTQGAMNTLSKQVAEMTDAQVFIAYVRLYEQLSTKERQALFAEQAKWLKAREKAAKDGVESTGGSLAPLELNSAAVTFSEKRLAELRARLKAAAK